MINNSALRTASFALSTTLGTIALSSLLSCSLVLDFDQCESDKDCTAIGQCIDNVCQEAERESITLHITDDTTWTANKTYVLEDIIMVVRPAVLTIEPGTKILAKRGAGLISQAGAKLIAEGTRERPIVFTSADPVGRRTAGNWAGLAMVGYAKTNRNPFDLRITPGEHDTNVGGNDDAWDCGTLKYVRVEFGGAEVGGQKALKGVTLAGCGSKTTIEYVQTHMSDDDGWAVFGGTVNLRHVVSTRPRDDGFDFDTAWRGTAQFVAVQQDIGGAEGLEVENVKENPDAALHTNARIYNYTLIGSNEPGNRQIGVYFRYGGLGTLSHGIIMGYKTSGVYIDGQHAADNMLEEKINIKNTMFFNLGPDGETYYGADTFFEGEDKVLEDYSYFERDDANNIFGTDPGIKNAHDLSNPGWVPAGDTPNIKVNEDIPAGFDQFATYRGAFAPNQIPWTEGWTAYPKN